MKNLNFKSDWKSPEFPNQKFYELRTPTTRRFLLITTIILCLAQFTKAQGNFELGANTGIFIEDSEYDFNSLFSLKTSVYFVSKEKVGFGAWGEMGKTHFNSSEDEGYFSKESNLVSFGLRLKYFLSKNGFNPYVLMEVGDSFLFEEETYKSFTFRGILGFEVEFNNSGSSWFLETGYNLTQYGDYDFAFLDPSPDRSIISANNLMIATGFRFWRIRKAK
jgi:hypothetical protein